MFGNTFRVVSDRLTLVLRPAKESDIPKMAEGMSDWQVRRYLGAMGGVMESNERDWINRTSESRDTVLWLIQPEGVDVDYAIGSTALHHIDDSYNSSGSGFVIWDKTWWGKGVASLAHIARTWFAARQLNRFTIVSHVFTPNEGSWRALEKVGYIRTGLELRRKVVDGNFIDAYVYSWINPYTLSITYPNGLPKEYEEGVRKAEETILKGDRYVRYV